MGDDRKSEERALEKAEESVIRGLGVDIVEIQRMRQALSRHPRLKARIFSEEEQRYCDRRNKPETHYAMRFAAKEAVLKAIGTGFKGMRFRDVEVVRDEGGRPRPILHGRAAEVAESAGVVELHLSLSFTHSTAVASAVAITAANRPRVEPQPVSAKERLRASFKEARVILEELHSSAERAGGSTERLEPSNSAGTSGDVT